MFRCRSAKTKDDNEINDAPRDGKNTPLNIGENLA
jgi:hypothetical protein